MASVVSSHLHSWIESGELLPLVTGLAGSGVAGAWLPVGGEQAGWAGCWPPQQEVGPSWDGDGIEGKGAVGVQQSPPLRAWAPAWGCHPHLRLPLSRERRPGGKQVPQAPQQEPQMGEAEAGPSS